MATTVDDHFTLFDLDLTVPARGPELKREVKGRPTLRPPEAMDATTWDARFSPHNRDYFMTAGDVSLTLLSLVLARSRFL